MRRSVAYGAARRVHAAAASTRTCASIVRRRPRRASRPRGRARASRGSRTRPGRGRWPACRVTTSSGSRSSTSSPASWQRCDRVAQLLSAARDTARPSGERGRRALADEAVHGEGVALGALDRPLPVGQGEVDQVLARVVACARALACRSRRRVNMASCSACSRPSLEREERVDRARARAGLLGDPAHRERVPSVRGRQALGRVQQPLARRLVVLLRASHGLTAYRNGVTLPHSETTFRNVRGDSRMTHHHLARPSQPAAGAGRPSRRCAVAVAAPRRRRSRSAVAVVDGATGETLTRGELAARSAALAAGLRERGVRPGDLVAVAMPNLAWWPVVALGVWRAGAAISPLEPAVDRRRVGARARAAPCRGWRSPSPRSRRPMRAALATRRPATTSMLAVVGGEAADATPIEALLALGDGDPYAEPDLRPEDLAAVPFSSGTGGLPKGVRITHGNLAAAAEHGGQRLPRRRRLRRALGRPRRRAVLPLDRARAHALRAAERRGDDRHPPPPGPRAAAGARRRATA